MLTYFALLRHAETEWNREGRIQGQRDSALTSSGRLQAQRWGRALVRYRLDYLVSSDLGRATQTASLINESLELGHSVEPRLREQDWGGWSGLKLAELFKTDDLKVQERMGWHFRPVAGESRLEVLARSQQALMDITHRLGGHRILVVTHGGVMKCLLYHLYGRRFLPEEAPLLEPYRLHWLSYDGQGFKVLRLNEEI